jgi:hypothetical protein
LTFNSAKTLDKTGLQIIDTENDILNRAYGRKEKNYGLASIADHTAHQEPIGKIMALKKGLLMIVLEQNSRFIKFFDQNLASFAQIATHQI